MTDPYAPQPQPSHQPGSVPPDHWRAADADRAPIFDRLRQAVDEGRLDLVEYDQRLRAAETAQTLQELDRVVADLPVPAEAVLVQIGEFAVTATTIHTPTGTIPLRGSQWTTQDQWLGEEKIPSWAIALAIVLFFCVGPFSLLFLLAKESTVRGGVHVSVTNGGRQASTYVPIASHQQVQHLHQQVNYVRSLAAR
jgi:hypothetical protein